MVKSAISILAVTAAAGIALTPVAASASPTIEGFSRCEMRLEPMKGAVKLTIVHTMDRPKSKLIDAVSGGWPMILSNLKSLLETGRIVVKNKPPKHKLRRRG